MGLVMVEVHMYWGSIDMGENPLTWSIPGSSGLGQSVTTFDSMLPPRLSCHRVCRRCA